MNEIEHLKRYIKDDESLARFECKSSSYIRLTTKENMGVLHLCRAVIELNKRLEAADLHEKYKRWMG